MKVEIDLNDILGDEYGTETLQDSVRRQVIETLTQKVSTGIGDKINREISQMIDEEIRKGITERMPSLINDLLNAEYVQVDRYGSSSGKKTCFREQLILSVADQCKYESRGYSSDKNVFTKAVDDVVRTHVETFKADYNKTVDSIFTKEALDYATEKLKKRLGV